MAWYPSPRRSMRISGLSNGNFAGTSIVVPMAENPHATIGNEIWRSILIGVGVSVGTTFALRVLESFFGGSGKKT